MSVARCREINARLRAAGITVHEWPGWESRGNGQASAYEGGLVHHTGSAFGSAPRVLVDGRPDLAGPLCNYAGNSDGSVTVIAAHPANHAGASGGRSMGPLPVTSLFNKRVLGLEIVYPGTVPMQTAQYRTALIWARVVTDVCGYGDIQRARAHAETSITGKWDPGDAPSRTINMAAFRAATRVQPEDPTVKNLILANKLGPDGTTPTGEIWVGDGITRRHVADSNELDGLKFWIGQKGGDATVHNFGDLRVLGKVDPEVVPVQIDYVRFVTDVVQQLGDRLEAAGLSLSPSQMAAIASATAAATVAEFKKEGN